MANFYDIKRWAILNKNLSKGNGCGSVGRAVVYDTSGPWFKSSSRQNFTMIFFCKLWKRRQYRKKGPGMAY